MTAWPDADLVEAFLRRAGRRVVLVAGARGAAAGFVAAMILALVGWPVRGATSIVVLAAGTLAVLGAAIGILVARSRAEPTSHAVERRAPGCRNVVITADELIASGSSAALGTSEYVAMLVCRDASRMVSRLDPAELFPGRRAFAALAAAAALWALVVSRGALPVIGKLSSPAAAAAVAAISSVEASVTPPAYSGRAASLSRDPARIEALVGSRIRLTVHASAASVAIETLSGKRVLAARGGDTFTGDIPADADGFIAIEPATAVGRAGARRLIGLTVLPDRAPRVRIVTPGRDLFLRDANHTIDLAIAADDDIGLALLRLRYTKVSGSGERFTFSEGELPIAITRTDARTWTAHAQWKLDGLGLSPGDMVVYRAVAADQRPGAVPVESDSYIAELLAPGGDAAAGFALDPDQERYAVSQQMIILKTERLAAKRASMTPDAFLEASQDIGVEQRKVRAEFVFMMGGELADAPDPTGNINDLNETAEAEGESDLAAGRMANQGRIALLRAIRSMSQASTSLTTADVTPALGQEHDALTQLERAFSRTRIILRALTQREALDLTRRLTGTLTDAARDVHPSADPQRDPHVTALRQALASIATVAGTPAARIGSASADVSDLAQRVLQVDPSSKALQEVATLLGNAATALGAGRTSDARNQLDRAATALAAALRSDLLRAPSVTAAPGLSRMGGVLADGLRHPRGKQ